MNCFTCKQDCSRSNIICAICNEGFHIKCAADAIPNMTLTLVETIKKSGGLLIYRCSRCLNVPISNDGSQVNTQVFTKKMDNLETKLQEITNILSNEVMSKLGSIETDLQNCIKRVDNLEESTNVKIVKLTTENNFLHKQLNRSDILINGLPSKISNDELYTLVEKMAQVLEVDLGENCINLCTWTRNKKVALIKFNSVKKRDELMTKYFAHKNLLLKQIIEDNEDEEARVYVNDHLPPMAENLQYMCRKLKRSGLIIKFRVKNLNIPVANITLTDGSNKDAKREELLKMFADSNLLTANTDKNTNI